MLPFNLKPFNLANAVEKFDQAHTRGTDLKLPVTCRGGLTLGVGQTKDTTVQAALRLRQLATTQEIIFFAPTEIDNSIRHYRGKTSLEKLDSYDVVHWLLDQTVSSNAASEQLFHSQGVSAMAYPNP